MNKNDAKRIAEIITNEELLEMFVNAKSNITDWTQVSKVNKGMSKGTAWNILASDFNVEKTYNNLAKVNMVREFGKYLPNHLKPVKKLKPKIIKMVHHEPNFKNF
jgi:hypothetical protein